MAENKLIKRETYDREGLRSMSEIILSGGEIPYKHEGKGYNLQLVCGVPEWVDAEDGEIASCKTQNDIYREHDTNQDEFWKIFEEAKKAKNKIEASYRNSTEKEKNAEKNALIELSRFISSNFSGAERRDIISGEMDILTVYGRLAKDKQLSRKYGKDLKKLESHVETIRQVYLRKNRKKGEAKS